MKKIFYLIIISPLLLLLAACATQQNYAMTVSSWHGQAQQQLYRVWGYPDQIEKLPTGNNLLIYRQVEHGSNPVYTTPGSTTVQTNSSGTYINSTQGYTSGGGSYYYSCTTWFELDSKGNIVNTSFRGNNCAATKNFVMQYSSPIIS